MRRLTLLVIVLLVAAAVPAAAVEQTGSFTPPDGKEWRRTVFNGTHAAIGFYHMEVEGEGRWAGVVRIYADLGSGWDQVATIEPTGLGEGAYFGVGMDLQGETLIVGAPVYQWTEDRPGTVRIYSGSGATWSMIDSFSSPVPADADRFGGSVALDGDVLVVGAKGTSSAYVYERAGGVWSLTASLAAIGGEDRFGYVVDVSGDTVVVGADLAAYVFVKGSSGWALQQRLDLPEKTYPRQVDGDHLICKVEEGVATYERSSGVWEFVQTITIPFEVRWHTRGFPSGTALRGDTLLVGHSGNGDADAVHVYGWLRSEWVRTDKFSFYRPSVIEFGDGGEVLVAVSPQGSWPYGEYAVFAPIDGAACGGLAPTIIGTAGDDYLRGTAGPDVIMGLEGDDTIVGLEGDDALCGGPGWDTVSFGNAASVTVDLSTGTATGEGADVLDGIERVIGSPGDDVLIGDDGDNQLEGRGGRDTLRGKGGKDVLDGGAHMDTVSYEDEVAGVYVDLGDGSSRIGSGNDTLVAIENLIGSDYSDTLIGNAGRNVIHGMMGDDAMDGGLGNDVLLGGPGKKDRVKYVSAPAAVYVDLGGGFATGGDGNDKINSVENATGSAHSDTLVGTERRNVLDGGAGNDVLIGLGGPDLLRGGDHSNYYVPGLGNDTVKAIVHKSGWEDIVSFEFSPRRVVVDLARNRAKGEGKDKLINVDGIVGSEYDDVIKATDAYPQLILPLGGADLVRGKNSDQVSYALSDNGVIVDLGSGVATGEGNDRLLGIREIVGSPFDDSLTGSSFGDAMWGLEGDDRMWGSSGDDYLDGMDGDDRLSGGSGTDVCRNGEHWSSCEYIRDQRADEAEEVERITALILGFRARAGLGR